MTDWKCSCENCSPHPPDHVWSSVVVLSVDDGWNGVYINGQLVQQSDNNTACNIIKLLEGRLLIRPGLVSFKEANNKLNEEISENGSFPEKLPGGLL